jgi:LPS-assembly protein
MEDSALVTPVGRRQRRIGTARCRRAALWTSLVGLLLGALLSLAQAARAQGAADDEEQPIVLTADELVFEQERRLITAIGNVELSRGERQLLADRVTYDEAAGRVVAHGNIVFIESSGDAFYAEEIEITGDLRDGFVKGVAALLSDDTRIAAVSGVRRGNETTLHKAVYSPCALCADGRGPPIWQIRADRVVHDQEARTLTYRNAFLEVFGVPVLFTPYFTHPDPTVRKRTGLLTPSFGSDSELGVTVLTPFFINVAPNYDVTLAPLFTTNAGTVLFGEARGLERFGRATVSGSITHADEFESDSGDSAGQGLRGHIRGQGTARLNELNRIGANGAWASDKTYLRRYNISNANILTSRGYFERIDGRDYYGLNALAFQGLRDTDDQDVIPFALPLAEAHVVGAPMRWGSHWTLDGNVLALTRTRGRDVRRLSGEAGWQLPYVDSFGSLYRARLSLRGDAYYVMGDPQDEAIGGGSDTAARLLPRATLSWSLPLFRAGEAWQHELEPVLALNLAPPGGNSKAIPNEDSIDFEFDESNLFLPIRFTGLDRNEGNSRLAYGLRFASLGPSLESISGALGQSLTFAPGDNPYPANSGLAGYLSDPVGGVEFRPSDLLDVTLRFRFDTSSMEFARNDVGLGLGPQQIRASLRYVKLSREAASDSTDDLSGREALIAGIRLQVTEELTVAAQTRQDLKAGETVRNTLGLVYEDECLLIVAGLEKDYTVTGEVDRPLIFSLRVGLKTLGELETGTGFFGL